MPTRPRNPKADKANKSGENYVHLRISPELKAKLMIIAGKSGMDLSNYARAAMIEKARRDGHTI